MHDKSNSRVKPIKRYLTEVPDYFGLAKRQVIENPKNELQAKQTENPFFRLWDDLFLHVLTSEDLKQWEFRLSGLSCSCNSFYKQFKIDNVAGDTVSFEWKWRLKTAVNAKLGKDNLTLDEAATVYGLTKPAAKRNDIVAITAFSVARHSIEHQRNCVDSWKRFGFDAYAKNTPEEIRILEADFPDVTFIESNDTSTEFAYPTQRIKALADTAFELDMPVLLINSDIELRGNNALIETDDQSMFCGVRWNYDTETPHVLTEFRYGIDAFTFTPKQAAMLSSSFPFAIGHAMWDYAVPAVMRQNGVELNIVHSPMLFHRNHRQNWSNEDWFFGQRWVEENLGLHIEYANPEFRDLLEKPGWTYSQTRWVRAT